MTSSAPGVTSFVSDDGTESGRAAEPVTTTGRHRLSAQVYARIVVASTLAVIALGSVLSWHQTRDANEELAERRATRAAIVARAIDGFIASHERTVSTVAGIAPRDPAGLQRAIETFRATHPDILTALATDPAGSIVAASPDASAGAPRVLGQSVADRDYFRAAMKSGTPYVSGAFLGRGFGNEPIVAIAAPIPGPDGLPDGIVEASLNLRRLESFTSLVRGLAGTRLLIVDPAGSVVYSSHPQFRALTEIASHGAVRDAAEGATTRAFADADGKRWSVASSRSERGWVVYVLQDTAVARRRMAGQLAITALFVALIAVAALAIARRFASLVTRPLETLAGTVRSMRGGEEPARMPPLDPKAPVEVAELFDDVREMAARVHASRRNLEQSNRQLEETLDLARAGSRTKTAFLAKMSHELRTPLNAIIGFSAILEQRLAGDDKGRELACRAHAAGEGMLHMIDELLEIARVESGQAELNPVDAHLAAIMLEGVRAAGEAHPGTVDRIALVRADDRSVRVDREHFAKAVSNVAAAASELTAASVRVEAHVEPSDDGGWIVATCTIREAVDRDTLGSLVDPFWQGETGTGAVKFGSTRLGLALAHRYAEIMGGNLDVRSAGEETIFTIRVPDGRSTPDAQPS